MESNRYTMSDSHDRHPPTQARREVERARVFSPPGVSAEGIKDLCQQAMRSALTTIEKRQQVLLALHYLERLTPEQIAGAMGITPTEAIVERERVMATLRRAFAMAMHASPLSGCARGVDDHE